MTRPGPAGVPAPPARGPRPAADAAEPLDALRRLQESESALRRSRGRVILRLATVVLAHSDETGPHIERVGALSGVIAGRLGLHRERREMVALGALLHDLGKVEVPTTILEKPGRLTSEERAVMERHTTLGWRMLAGSGETLLDAAADIALTHHERYDGRGYPNRLRGDAIPPAGGIVAVADVFDSLTRDRAYRDALSVEDASAVLAEGRGTLFDPRIVDAFLADRDSILDEIRVGAISI